MYVCQYIQTYNWVYMCYNIVFRLQINYWVYHILSIVILLFINHLLSHIFIGTYV